MLKLTCWHIKDSSEYEATKDLKGPSYAFLFEYVDAMGEIQTLAQFLGESVLRSAGRNCFDLVAKTIEERTGLNIISAEDVRQAFSDSKDVSEFTGE